MSSISQPRPHHPNHHGAVYHHDPAFALHAPPKVCTCQRLVWPRRLHALAGLMVMLFLVVHLGACAFGISPGNYASTVGSLEALIGMAPAVFLSAIFLPLLFQAGSGLYLLNHHGMKFNVNKCHRGGRVRFFLQRLTAILLLAFLVLHVATLHVWGLHAMYRLAHFSSLGRYAAGGLFQPGAAYNSTVLGIRTAWNPGAPGNPLNLAFSVFTLIGALAAAFHAGNGIWSGGIVWKLAPTPARRVLLGSVAILGVVFFSAAGIIAWYAFTFSGPARLLLSSAS